MTTLQTFINRNRITAHAEWADRNPNTNDMPAGSSYWRVTLRHDGRQLTVPYSMGPAHSREPEAIDVLDALASDASGYENARSFEEWAEEYGYETDSRRAERVYRAVERQTTGLQRLMGDKYRTLLWDTERE